MPAYYKTVIIAVLAVILAFSLLMYVGASGAKKALEQELRYAKAENLSLAKNLDELRDGNKRLQEQIAALNNDLRKAAEEKEAFIRERDALKEQYARTAGERDELEEKLRAQAVFSDENAALKRQLSALNETKAGLEKRAGQLGEEKSRLELKISQMQASLASAEERKEPEAAPIELPAIVVSPRQEEGADRNEAQAPGISGSVVSVNRDNNFVIIDLGIDDGVKTGETLSVYRKGRQAASIEVIQARRKISACDIKKETTPIQAGDTVR